MQLDYSNLGKSDYRSNDGIMAKIGTAIVGKLSFVYPR